MNKLKRILKFSRPKPGPITISKSYYLTVLAGRAQMPTILSILNPKGEGGAVFGMGVPLAVGADKSALGRSMERGAFALSTPDQLTVLKMYVMPKQEAGFDPNAFVRNVAMQAMDKEILLRIEATWMLAQLTFESYDPQVYSALEFLLSIAKRIAELTDGVIADPVCQTYRLPQFFSSTHTDILAPEHIEVKIRPQESGLHMYTLGLSKFDQPEIEVYGVSPSAQTDTARFLYGLAQAILHGGRLEPGAEVGDAESPVRVAEGGLDKAIWGDARCYELIPANAMKIEDSIAAWVVSSHGP